MFKSIKLRIINGRQLRPFPTAKVLQEHEDRLTALEGGEAINVSETTEGSLAYRIKALETILGDSDDDTLYDDTVLAQRISALEEMVSEDLSFTVNDGTDPVQGAVVTVTTGKTGTTGSSGGCTVSKVLPATYTVTVTAEGFEDYSDSIVVDKTHTSFTISLTAVTPETPAEQPSTP